MVNFLLFISFLLLQSACPATGLRTKKTQTMVKPNGQEVLNKLVTVVMLDDTYRNLFDCWADFYSKNTSVKKMDVVTYGRNAYDHAMQYQQHHPGVVRSVKLIVPEVPSIDSKTADKKFAKAGAKSHQKHQWPSIAYQANYYKVISEYLDRGEHVLHMDLDAIAVGDPWAAIAEVAGTADIVSPNYGRDAEYVFFKSTQATREVAHMLNQPWQKWLNSFSASGEPNWNAVRINGAPPPDQGALKEYLAAEGDCAKSDPHDTHIQMCKTHTGKPLPVGNTRGVIQDGVCVYPEGCAQKGYFVVHGRRLISEKKICEKYPDMTNITSHP